MTELKLSDALPDFSPLAKVITNKIPSPEITDICSPNMLLQDQLSELNSLNEKNTLIHNELKEANRHIENLETKIKEIEKKHKHDLLMKTIEIIISSILSAFAGCSMSLLFQWLLKA